MIEQTGSRRPRDVDVWRLPEGRLEAGVPIYSGQMSRQILSPLPGVPGRPQPESGAGGHRAHRVVLGEDPLAPARGCLIGLAIGVVLWSIAIVTLLAAVT
jgi:hypothetical protein